MVARESVQNVTAVTAVVLGDPFGEQLPKNIVRNANWQSGSVDLGPLSILWRITSGLFHGSSHGFTKLIALCFDVHFFLVFANLFLIKE
jgi:hypothetical protein